MKHALTILFTALLLSCLAASGMSSPTKVRTETWTEKWTAAAGKVETHAVTAGIGTLRNIVFENLTFNRNVTITGVRTRDSQTDLPIEEVVQVIEQKTNPDYPKTTPRGGTGKGIWIQ